ncbi:MAG: phosphoribosylformylglycinamidine synthase subunit PurL [Thermoplasmata archaeon]|nr:phosphoribosylformylglycinamidine synthase subunit PurL [Thermoplasmata archaeon]
MPAISRIDLQRHGDDSLRRMSAEMGLALSVEEMRRIGDYFAAEGREASNVELQALGQAWSEHSCYKSSKLLLKQYVFNIPCKDFVCNEDAGVVHFDDEHDYVVGFESHNHPSAVEPYGGAATGIGGILRDVLCMGAQPILLVDPLFFGPLDQSFEDLPEGIKHPRYLFRRVVDGIADYGNRVGIPTTTGMVYFHEGFTGNCLVNVGCIGIAKRKHIVRSRAGGAGEIFVLAGGSTGRDGIHGVTFASEVLDEDSHEEDVGAVQLGDPITKEPLIHACLEAVERGLVTGMKDLGGGGLSSCIGEMAHAAGCGAIVELDKVFLRQEGMQPWEIWISESQERMAMTVRPDRLNDLLATFDSWDVFAAAIGRTVPGRRIAVTFHGETVLDLDLAFYSGGPEYRRPFNQPAHLERTDVGEEPVDYGTMVLAILGSPNVSSREWIIRQYDHQVRGNTVLPPLQGVLGSFGPGDAAIVKPVEGSFRGLAVTADVNPEMCRLDPYWGACATIDEIVRNLVSVGSKPHSLADCLNFGNPENPDRMGEFTEVLRGFSDIARALDLPFISGNVSFYNEAPTGPIPPTPAVIGVGIIDDVRDAITLSLKEDGNALMLLGITAQELGGSQYYRHQGLVGTVPRVDIPRLSESIDRLLSARPGFDVLAVHDLSEGGLAVALAEMCIAGDRGAEIDLAPLEELRTDHLLFSESATRWIVEIPEEQVDSFVAHMSPVPARRIGTTGGDLAIGRGNGRIANLSVERLREAWNRYIPERMGS